MPRPPRKQFAGALYHVTTRGNGRRRIFLDDADRKRFLSQLRDCLENYEVVLYAYVLMPNHYHLLVRTAHPNLARFMQRLNTSYALYSRYKHRRPGHQLEGRYKAKLVQSDEYIMTLTRYIHLNPVKVKALRMLAKTERQQILERSRWSSYGGYVDERHIEDFVCYGVLKALDENQRRARGRYRNYLMTCLMEDDSELRRAFERSGHGIGDEEYIETLEQELRQRKSGTIRDRDVAYPDERVPVARIDEVVAREYRTVVEALKVHGRNKGTGTAKVAAIELACRLSGITQRDVGAYYGGISSQAVSLARKRAKVMLPADTLARLANIIQKQSHGA
jgi:REP element-mobilizing transposase RayT